MRIFVAASYSANVNYDTGEVLADYRDWLERLLARIESSGHTVICALREDNYHINDADPAGAFKLDTESIKQSDALLALLTDSISAGVQTEIGYALALGKRVLLAHKPEVKLAYINGAMVRAGIARELLLPLSEAQLQVLSARQ